MPQRTEKTTKESLFLTPKEAARVLGVSVQTIQHWTDSGKMKCVRTKGNHRRIPKEEIEKEQ